MKRGPDVGRVARYLQKVKLRRGGGGGGGGNAKKAGPVPINVRLGLPFVSLDTFIVCKQLFSVSLPTGTHCLVLFFLLPFFADGTHTAFTTAGHTAFPTSTAISSASLPSLLPNTTTAPARPGKHYIQN